MKSVKLQLMGFLGFVQPVEFTGLYGTEVVVKACGTSVKSLDSLFPKDDYGYNDVIIGEIPADVKAEIDAIDAHVKEMQSAKMSKLKQYAISRENFIELFQEVENNG